MRHLGAISLRIPDVGLAFLFQEIGLDEVESLLRRPRSNAKERLVEVLLELVASCK